MSSQQNEIYSKNNRSSLGTYATFLGTYLAVFYGFIKVLLNNPLDKQLFFMVSIGVILVVTLLAILSISMGYSRRRDHIMAILLEKGENNNNVGSYEKFVGNGLGKSFFSFLMDIYLIFTIFFILVLTFLFLLLLYLNDYMFEPCDVNLNFFIVEILIVISLFVIIIVWFAYYYKYKNFSNKINIEKKKDKNIGKNVNININNII